MLMNMWVMIILKFKKKRVEWLNIINISTILINTQTGQIATLSD